MKKRFLQEVGKTGEITSFIKSQLTKKPIKILTQNFGIDLKSDSKTFFMSKYASIGIEFGINFDINWEYYSIRSDRINFFQQFQMDCWISARVTTKKNEIWNQEDLIYIYLISENSFSYLGSAQVWGHFEKIDQETSQDMLFWVRIQGMTSDFRSNDSFPVKTGNLSKFSKISKSRQIIRQNEALEVN